MIKNSVIIISSIILVISCGKPTYTKEECIVKTSDFINSSFDSVVFLKYKKFGATNKLYFKLKDNDSIVEYKTQSAWPISLNFFYEKGDVIKKKKGDSILYMIKKDTILKYQYACDESYINGRPIGEILKEKGIIRR